MATEFRPRAPMGDGVHGYWRANVRQHESLNLRVQPAIGFERRRPSLIGLVLFITLFFILTLGLLNLFTTMSMRVPPESLAVITPMVTVQLVGAMDAPGLPALPTAVVEERMPALSAVSTPNPVFLTVNSDVGYINVRSGPGVNFETLGTLATGQTAPVTGRSTDGKWWRITFQNRVGWVYSPLARLNGDSAQLQEVATP